MTTPKTFIAWGHQANRTDNYLPKPPLEPDVPHVVYQAVLTPEQQRSLRQNGYDRFERGVLEDAVIADVQANTPAGFAGDIMLNIEAAPATLLDPHRGHTRGGDVGLIEARIAEGRDRWPYLDDLTILERLDDAYMKATKMRLSNLYRRLKGIRPAATLWFMGLIPIDANTRGVDDQHRRAIERTVIVLRPWNLMPNLYLNGETDQTIRYPYPGGVELSHIEQRLDQVLCQAQAQRVRPYWSRRKSGSAGQEPLPLDLAARVLRQAEDRLAAWSLPVETVAWCEWASHNGVDPLEEERLAIETIEAARVIPAA